MERRPGDLVIEAIDLMEARFVKHLEAQTLLLIILIVPLYADIGFGLCFWAVLR